MYVNQTEMFDFFINQLFLFVIIKMVIVMSTRKGFTLVELLAVIVVLAIIMIIAIPAVLNTMKIASLKSFSNYYFKIYREVEKKYIEDSSFGKLSRATGESIYIYDIEKDLNIPSTGSFHGFVSVHITSGDPYYDVFLYNDDYALIMNNCESKELTNDRIVTREFAEKKLNDTLPFREYTTLDKFDKMLWAELENEFRFCITENLTIFDATDGHQLGQIKVDDFAGAYVDGVCIYKDYEVHFETKKE